MLFAPEISSHTNNIDVNKIFHVCATCGHVTGQ